MVHCMDLNHIKFFVDRILIKDLYITIHIPKELEIRII